MLTDKQKNDLEIRNDKNVSPRRRADVVHRYTGKLEDRLNDIADINYLLRELPSSNVKKIVSYGHVYKALELVEELLGILDPAPIEEDREGVWQYVKIYRIINIKGIEGMKYDAKAAKKGRESNQEALKVSFPASEDEIQNYQKLSKIVDRIKNFLDDDLRIDSPKYKFKSPPKYTLQEFGEIISKIAEERGQLYQVKTVSSIYTSADNNSRNEILDKIDDKVKDSIKG
jgi:hypothetical protein